MIELLKEQLQRKDEQIYLLNERVKDLTEALKASQTIQAMYIQKIEEHEQDPEQEPPEHKKLFSKAIQVISSLMCVKNRSLTRYTSVFYEHIKRLCRRNVNPGLHTGAPRTEILYLKKKSGYAAMIDLLNTPHM